MIVVADRGNDRLQAFYPDGTFAFKFGAGYGNARSIDVGVDGRIVVVGGSYYAAAAVIAFHPNGTYAFQVAGQGEGIGFVDHRALAAIAPDGRIVVVDGNRVQVFSPDGAFDSVFDLGRGVEVTGVDVGPDGLIVVADGGGVDSTTGYENGTWWWANPGHVRAFHPNGTSAFSFAVVDWGYPATYAMPVGVGVGPEGEVVVLERGYFWSDAVRVYRPHPNGTFAFAFNVLDGRSGVGVRGLEVGPGGMVFVGNENDTVSVYHPNGSLALTFGGHGSVQGGFDRPTDAAVAPDGRIVVAEPGNRTISVFHPNGTLDFSFGKYGHGDDGFYEPHHVAVAPDGRIVVGDTRKHRILVFEPDGSPALAFGSRGYGAGQISGVRDVAVTPNGSVVVVDSVRYGRVQVFSPDGSTVSELRHDDYDRYSGWGSGWYPARAAVAPDGRIVVAEDGDYGEPSVHAFETNGTVAFTIHLDRDADGADAVVAVAPDGRIVVAQGSRSQVFNPDGTFAFATEIDVEAVSVAVGPNREIVVVDDDADRVQVFNPNGTFAFSLLPDLSEGKFNGIRAIAVGPVMPSRIGDPEPLWAVIEEPDMDGPILRNFTGAGDAANVTIDVAALAGGPGGPDALNGSESSTVTFPATNTTVIASFAEVTFPPNVTASHVPAGGLLGLRVATLVPTAEQVQAALGRSANGSGPERVVLLQSVVEVGGDQSRIMFDLPIRIALEGQAGGRAFYIEGPNGTIVPIDLACAADGVDAVHRQLGGAGECQMDSADGAKIIYTYHLTKFGTVSAEGPVPGIVIDSPVPVLPPPRPGVPDAGSNSTNGTATPPPPGPVVVPQGPPTSIPIGGGGSNGTNGTATPPPPAPPTDPTPPVVIVPDPGGMPALPPTHGPTCSVYLASPEFALTAMPGGYSEPFVQEVWNAGTLPFAQVEIEATPWQDAAMPLPAAPHPGVPVAPGGGMVSSVFTAYLLATMPASVTEVREECRIIDGMFIECEDGVDYAPLVDGTAVVGRGLGAGDWVGLSFRLNLTPYDALQGGTLTQSVTYQAECVEPEPQPGMPGALPAFAPAQ